MKAPALTWIFLFLTVSLFAQKKQIGHEELVTWKQVQNQRISNDGAWVAWSEKAEEGDATLRVWNEQTGSTLTFERGEGARFSEDSEYLVFTIKPHADSLIDMRRRKVKKDELPKDSIGILTLRSGNLEKVANVKKWSVPEKWSGYLVMHMEVEKPAKKEEEKSDSIKMEEVPKPVEEVAEKPAPAEESKEEIKKEKKKKAKKESKKNGTKLLVRNLQSGDEGIFQFVLSYTLAEEAAKLMLVTTGNDSTLLQGIYQLDCPAQNLTPLWRQKGKYKRMRYHRDGSQLAFLANLDTTDAQVAPYGLFYWNVGQDSARIIADSSATFLKNDWIVSENAQPRFSKDGSKLYFGMAPQPILQDTSLLDEEIVQVEVWSYTDGRLHTQQKVRLNQEKNRSYDIAFHTKNGQFVPLATPDMPELNFESERNADKVIGYTEEPYLQLISWEGRARKDVWLVDVNTGKRKEILRGLRGTPRLSPSANYAVWYDELDSVYYSYTVATGAINQITNNDENPFYNELNDTPNYPWSYGTAAWTKDDRHLLIYDRFDIWQVDPAGKSAPVNLTKGRDKNLVYRYVQLDPEERFVESGQKLLLRIFDEATKASGYGFLTLGAGQPVSSMVMDDYNFTWRVRKAKNADKVIWTKQNFQTFPNLQYSTLSFQNPRTISDVNPQQSQYSWGSIELYKWTALDGQELSGMLVKPEGFDPSKQYPMIVNFYERSSNRLHNYPRPYPGRSTINYAYYASQGYLIFNPDVPYRVGYPGESCENSVLPGVASLINQGFVDKERIGVQGHSWGGYQVAHLLTRTDMFRCAESGAPVVNMFSAYGGIRWGSGMSRMFQYEHTQSRIGGTIWEYPLRYLENSPLFFTDKVNTPVLILHNDEDGAVPWYQGIEYFVALRRLGKPAWMLNYNGEPHWPVKLQNRKDFQLRMSQFFDHYLKDAPMPEWMERGVPAIEKGIKQGLEPSGMIGEKE